MKLTGKAIAWMLLLAGICFGCELGENVVEYQTGVWNVTSMKTKTYRDGVLASDETQTDSLGQMQFNATGQGYRIDFSAARDTFTWEHYIEEQRLVIYYRIGPFANAAIMEKSDNAMTLFWVNSEADGTVMVNTERTATIERSN
jgi:hypothetical protein